MARVYRTSQKKKSSKRRNRESYHDEHSSFMDCVEYFVTLKSRENIEKAYLHPDKKKRNRYFKKLFEFLGGGDSPVEAIELALGRDSTLKETQFSIISIFSLWIDELESYTVAGLNEKKKLLTFLSDRNIVKLLIRLIMLKPSQSSRTGIFNKYLYYYCMNILGYITDKQFIESSLERFHNIKTIQRYEGIPRLVQFLNPQNNDPLLVYQTAEVLHHLAIDQSDICISIHKCDGLKTCLHYMMHKETDKLFMDYFQTYFTSKLSMSSEDVEIIEKFYSGKKYWIKREERYPPIGGHDYHRDCFIHMANLLQKNCGHIVLEITRSSNIPKSEILSLKPFMKVLSKWFSTPCIWRKEKTMLCVCLTVLECIITCDKPVMSSEDLLKKYDIWNLLEQHVYNPDCLVVLSVLNLVKELSFRYNDLKSKFMSSTVYRKLLPIFIQSYQQQIQTEALKILITFAQTKAGAEYVFSIGITAEQLFLLMEYNWLPTAEGVKHLKAALEEFCPGEWNRSEEKFREDLPGKYSLPKALKFKEEGNARFNAEKYDSAVMCYTFGIENVPPVEHFPMELIEPDPAYKPWYALPAVLFTNRAQCYISLKKWKEAIEDCTQAIIRSYEDNDEARKILFKTSFRRARAFMELKDYKRALNDISFCLRIDVTANNVRWYFREILTAYRKEFGIEPLRRCGTCMEGLGMKLKRCAKCPELYCSRDCQTYAWEEGHKHWCNYSLDENNSE